MALCELCGREMITANGCSCETLVNAENTVFKRIRMGAHGDFYARQGGSRVQRCGDCGAKRGYFHHRMCDCETCPVCGKQLISCDCGLFYSDVKGGESE